MHIADATFASISVVIAYPGACRVHHAHVKTHVRVHDAHKYIHVSTFALLIMIPTMPMQTMAAKRSLAHAQQRAPVIWIAWNFSKCAFFSARVLCVCERCVFVCL